MNEKDMLDNLFNQSKNELGKHSKPQAQVELKKQFNKLKHKALYLNLEHEEITEEFQEIKREFISKMLEFCSNKNLSSPFEDKGCVKEKEQNIENKSPKEINDLFREVVKKTHPDLNQNLPEEEKLERLNLYNEIIEGKQGGDFRKILQAALELNVSIKNISPELIRHLKKEIQKMHKQIQQIKNDIMYKWGKGDDNLKKQIFELLTKNLKPLK